MAKKAARRAKPATLKKRAATAKLKPKTKAGKSSKAPAIKKAKARPADDQKYTARADRGAGAEVYLVRLEGGQQTVAQALHDALMRAGAKGAAASGHQFTCGLKWGYPAYSIDGAMAAQLYDTKVGMNVRFGMGMGGRPAPDLDDPAKLLDHSGKIPCVRVGTVAEANSEGVRRLFESALAK